MSMCYDSDSFAVSYEADFSAAIVVFKRYDEGESFRVALMQAAEFIRKNRCTNLIVESTQVSGLTDNDRDWMKKTFLDRLDRIGCRKIILILGDQRAGNYPKEFCRGRITVLAASGTEEALAMAKGNKEDKKEELKEGLTVEPSQESSMTKAEAIEYLGLSPEATSEEIDDKFWQLSKVYSRDRNLDPDEKTKALDKLSDIYDIASGRRDERVAEETARANEKKYFGKTSKEWKNYVYYSWYKYVIAIVLIAAGAHIIWSTFFQPPVDCGWFSVGHFYYENTYLEQVLTDEMGFKNPYINFVDVAVPNTQNQVSDQYADQIAVTGFYSHPNVLVTDEMSVAYFYDEMSDCTEVYERLRQILPEEKFEKIIPVYLSPHDAYYASDLYGEDNRPTDDTDIMCGLMVKDEDFINDLGYYNKWPESEASLVFTICSTSMNTEDSVNMLVTILSRI